MAGGLGTRLQGVIGAQPKCMAPVNGRPFLGYLLDYLERQKCTRAIMSLGFKHNVVIDWLEEQYLQFELDCAVEKEPLGTGGGILAAMEDAATENVVILNGDTMFEVDLQKMMAFHKANNAVATLALKRMTNFDRYGVVHTNDKGIITSFEEKKPTAEGYINGGVYIVNADIFLAQDFPQKFSFEKEFLEKYVGEKKFYGYTDDGYFIDIGIPADYEKAQADFKSMYP